MTDPDRSPAPSLAQTAAEPPEESVRREREAVGGDQPDTGNVPPDNAQSAPPSD